MRNILVLIATSLILFAAFAAIVCLVIYFPIIICDIIIYDIIIGAILLEILFLIAGLIADSRGWLKEGALKDFFDVMGGDW